jgi:uncharacterized protein, YhcH/YjgK/YiaL family
MVVDNIENFGKYISLNPLFKEVLDFLNSTDLNAHELGKCELVGSSLFVKFAQTKPKTKEEARLESHNKYIDIQIPVSGNEIMGYTPRTSLPQEDYNVEKDVTFYKGMAENYINVEKNMFAIFFPEDAHAPEITSNGIKKVIVKVIIK